MSWDYAWQAGPDGGTLVDLADYCTSARVVDEGGAGKRGTNIVIPGLEGRRSDPHKFSEQGLLGLEIVLRYTNAAGAVTHPDGAAGHAYDNLSQVKRLLYGHRTLTRLQRTAPDHGTVYVLGEVLQPVRISQARHVFLFPLTLPVPSWHSTTENSQTPTPSVTVGGDFPVNDAVLEFVGGTDPVLTHTDSGAELGVQGAVPAGGVRIFIGEGRAEYISGGANATNLLTPANRRYWMSLDPGQVNAFSAVGGSTITLKWRDQWRAG